MASRLTVLALLALAACAAPGRAERIGTRSDGGSVMLSANNDKAWDSAQEIMDRDCPDGWRVVSQVQEGTGGRGGPPPATPGAMADPVGMAGAPFGLRVDYECTKSLVPKAKEPEKG